VLLTPVNKTDSNVPKYSLLHTRQVIFNKPQLSLLKKPFKDICLCLDYISKCCPTLTCAAVTDQHYSYDVRMYQTGYVAK